MNKQTLNGAEALKITDLMASPEKAMPKKTLAKHSIMPAKAIIPELEMPEENQVVPKPITRKRDSAHYEKGIAETVANGQTVVEYLITYGASYNPSNPDLSITSLQAKNVEANQLIKNIVTNKQANTLEINKRQDVYGNLKKLATRIINELEASGASKKVVSDARHFVDKIRGQRIIKIKPDDTNQNHISVSQTTFAQQVQHFGGLIEVVGTEPLYNPNQANLQLTALKDKQDAMISSNKTAGTSQAELGAARLQRNHFFNQPYTGYVDTYLAVKRAVKATFGPTSLEYRQIRKLPFSRIRP